MSRCEDCSLADGCRTNKMEGEGPSKADIMIVGDAPGYTDDEVGRPFQGDTGAKFTYLMRKAGLNKKKVYLTNAIKCRPWKMDQIKKPSIDQCRKHLFNEILEVKPKVIIAMGKYALEMLTRIKDIGDERGFFSEFELDYDRKISKTESVKKTFKCQIMPTYSSYSALTRWEFDSQIVRDLQNAAKFAETGALPQPPELTHDFLLDMKSMLKATTILENSESISFDKETTGLMSHKHKVVMVGFCAKPGHSYIFPTHIYTEEDMKRKWTAEEKKFALEVVNPFVKKHSKEIWECIRRVLRSKARKTAHNGKFDDKFARANDIKILNWDFDSIMAHSLVDENKPHNLIFVGEWYGIHYGNYEKQLWPYVNKDRKNKKPYSCVPPKMLAYYLAIDCDIAKRLRPILTRELKKEGMLDMLKKQQMPLIKIMSEWEFRGVKVDVAKLQSTSKAFSAVLAGIDKDLKKITKNKTFNPNSPAQLLDYFETIGAPLEKKTSGGKYSTDADVLTNLAAMKKWAKVPKLILEQRTITKLKGTYLDGKTGEDGILSWVDKNYMVHANWNAFTPRTGRMSCEDPPLQTIPRPNPKYPDVNIRQLFITSNPKNVIFSIDYKQLEMRIAAFLSRDMVMVNEIRNNVDIHSRNMVMFGTKLGILPKDMTEDKFIAMVKWKAPEGRELTAEEKELKQLSLEYIELRNFAKSLGFGLNYGMEAQTLANEHNQDVDEVQDMIDIYFDKYKSLALWREEQKQTSINKGVLILPETGRKRRFYDAADWFNHPLSKECRKREMDIESIYRQAMNFPIQGFANEVFTQGKIKFVAAYKEAKLKSRGMLSLHDGILGEGPMEEMKRVKHLAVANMERKLGEGKKYEVNLGVDFELYDRWAGKKLVLAT